MQEDMAILAGKRDVPNFGHLARELLAQQKLDLMRALIKGRELSPYNYSTVANLLATRLDPTTFELLVTNSSLTMPPPKGQEGYSAGKDIITWPCIPEESAFVLGRYLNSEAYGARAESHLIMILKHHKRTGVRACAAEALGNSKSERAVKALQEAVADKGRAPCPQCPLDYVGEYAQQALNQMKSGH